MSDSEKETFYQKIILGNLGDSSLKLKIILFEKEMEIGKIVELNIGNIIHFPSDSYKQAHISINDKIFAHGEIIKQGERGNYALRIEKIAQS